MRCPRPDCDLKLSSCEDCNMPFCRECEPDGVREERRTCESCHAKWWAAKLAEYGWMRGAVRAHRDTCELLGLPPDASDEEIMAASRALK